MIEAYLRRGIHKIELEQVLDPKGFQEQYRIRKIGSLDFGNVIWEHFISICHLSV